MPNKPFVKSPAHPVRQENTNNPNPRPTRNVSGEGIPADPPIQLNPPDSAELLNQDPAFGNPKSNPANPGNPDPKNPNPNDPSDDNDGPNDPA